MPRVAATPDWQRRGSPEGVTPRAYDRPDGEPATSSGGCSAPRTPRRSSSGSAWRRARYLQLDDVVALERHAARRRAGRASTASSSQVRARHEGARFDSDVFLIADGVLPAEVSEAAQVQATRFEPEMFVPPLPGDEVRKATGARARRGAVLRRHGAAGCPPASPATTSRSTSTSSSSTAPGAPTSTSAASRGVATKTSYATFLLYCLFHSGVLGAEAANTKALIFNVKGEDLLFLDHPNTAARRRPARPLRARSACRRRRSQSSACSPRRAGATPTAAPDVASRTDGRDARSSGPSRSSAASELLPFLFADAEDDRQQYTMVVHNVAARLRAARRAGRRRRGQHRRPGGAHVPRARRPHRATGSTRRRRPRTVGRAGPSAPARSTRSSAACYGAVRHVEHLDPGRRRPPRARTASTSTAPGHRRRPPQPERPGQALRRRRRSCARPSSDKERSGQARPLQFVVLDELNKYAPRDGSSPIKEILLDVAERGRSLGIILIGAQQTASEVERRIVANSAIRVVGRLDAAEAGRGEYGFLPAVQRQRATILKPGTMIVTQPELPDAARRRVPVPGLGHPGGRGRRQPGRHRPARRTRSRACRPEYRAPSGDPSLSYTR